MPSAPLTDFAAALPIFFGDAEGVGDFVNLLFVAAWCVFLLIGGLAKKFFGKKSSDNETENTAADDAAGTDFFGNDAEDAPQKAPSIKESLENINATLAQMRETTAELDREITRRRALAAQAHQKQLAAQQQAYAAQYYASLAQYYANASIPAAGAYGSVPAAGTDRISPAARNALADGILADRDALRRAVLAHEILLPPLALRNRSFPREL